MIIDREGNNLNIKISDTDSITVSNAYGDYWGRQGRYFVENIEFSDGTVLGKDEINREAAIRYGTDEGDTMVGYGASAGYSGNEELHGQGGDDTIRGNDGSDELYGEEGNDSVYGGNGDDILVGGAGNDYIEGNAGNDTYIFNLGDGHDSIYDFEDSDTAGRADKIVLGKGIKYEDVVINREGNNLKIIYSDNDTVTVNNAYGDYWGRQGRFAVENIEFSGDSLYGINYNSVSLELIEKYEREADNHDSEELASTDFTVEDSNGVEETVIIDDTISEDVDFDGLAAQILDSELITECDSDETNSFTGDLNVDNIVNLVVQEMAESSSDNVSGNDIINFSTSDCDNSQLWVANE